MAMRDYEEMKHIVIPKEQEEMMDIVSDAWEECRSLETCKECKDRPEKFMRMMMCTALKYTRKLIEAGYAKQPTADVQEVRRGHWIEDKETGCLICSECGRFTDEIIGDMIEQNGKIIHRSMYPFYCSKCGAKMDGKE